MANTEQGRQSYLRSARILDQRGPLGLHETFAPGSKQTPDKFAYTSMWLGALKPGDRAMVNALREEAKLIFGIKYFSEIPSLITNRERQEEISNINYQRIGDQYQIEGSINTIKGQVARYAEIADGVISYLQQNILNSHSTPTETINEIRHTSNPIDLLLIYFDPDRYSKRARFEALRKLMLMELAASVDQEQRAQDPVDKLREFDDFLYRHVWKAGTKIGDAETSYLFSTHNLENFECQNVEVIDRETARQKGANLDSTRELLTPVRTRVFEYQGRDISVYFTTRPKDPVAQILKMLRKNTDNPKVAVEDNLGFMGVFNAIEDVDAFQEVIQKAMAAEGLIPRLRDFSDTLPGGEYNGNAGSSPKTRMRKFHLDFPDRSIEIILHTNQSFINYYYSDDVGHPNFIVNRSYDSGVVSLLFPPKALEDPFNLGIYDLDLKEARASQIEYNKVRRGSVS